MDRIKLFICCHQPSQVPKHPLLVPVQVGAALAQERFPGFLYDDDGENISEKNRSYCELTAQYWAWKNADADWYGFFHYRRFLAPEPNARKPYRIEGDPTEALLDRLGYGSFAEIIGEYDLVAPLGEDMHISAREHYAAAAHHHAGDLALVECILKERHPEMAAAAEKYLSCTMCLFGNIYIMRKPVFHDYCAWLFPILEEFDRRADVSAYGPQERRVNGYLAERLFGVWLTHVRGSLRVLELPRVHFVQDKTERRKKQLLNMLLPPGTRRRACCKRLGKR